METVEQLRADARLEARANELREVVDAIILQARALEASVVADPDLDLSRPELLAIEILGDSGPSIMRSLAEQLFLAVNSVTTLVDNLERKSLVRRERDSNDRRLVWVHLTEQGRSVYKQNVEERLRLCRALLEALTEDEQEIFLVLNRKIARAARQFVAQSQS